MEVLHVGFVRQVKFSSKISPPFHQEIVAATCSRPVPTDGNRVIARVNVEACVLETRNFDLDADRVVLEDHIRCESVESFAQHFDLRSLENDGDATFVRIEMADLLLRHVDEISLGLDDEFDVTCRRLEHVEDRSKMSAGGVDDPAVAMPKLIGGGLRMRVLVAHDQPLSR